MNKTTTRILKNLFKSLPTLSDHRLNNGIHAIERIAIEQLKAGAKVKKFTLCAHTILVLERERRVLS